MINVTLYSRFDCHLCDEAIAHLAELQEKIPHKLVVVDIDGNRDLQESYGLEIPVVEIGPYRLKAPISRVELEITLRAATDRQDQIERIEEANFGPASEARWAITWADRISYWLSNHYMAVFNLFVLIYVGLPFLAPVLMASGWTGPARSIYRVYGAVCHQLAYRSWFLFGEQPAYPREAARVPGLFPYEQAIGLDSDDLWAAREFIGNPTIGYKVAFCERDVAIYGGILLFGVVFGLSGRRIKGLPWYLWIALGIMPIAADGLSQIFSQPPLDTIPPFNLLPYRESTPFLRTLTGGLFGLTTAWFGYPYVEESMADTRRYVSTKIARLRRVENL